MNTIFILVDDSDFYTTVNLGVFTTLSKALIMAADYALIPRGFGDGFQYNVKDMYVYEYALDADFSMLTKEGSHNMAIARYRVDDGAKIN